MFSKSEVQGRINSEELCCCFFLSLKVPHLLSLSQLGLGVHDQKRQGQQDGAHLGESFDKLSVCGGLVALTRLEVGCAVDGTKETLFIL